MIRVSTRGRYGLRAMVDLAQHADGEPVARQEIAARQDISPGYVAHIFRALNDAGLIESIKGPGGGYRLAREAARISVLDVVQAVEGPVAVVPCVDPEDESPVCNRIDHCASRLVWSRLSTLMADFLDSISLEELRDEARQFRKLGLRNRDKE